VLHALLLLDLEEQDFALLVAFFVVDLVVVAFLGAFLVVLAGFVVFLVAAFFGVLSFAIIFKNLLSKINYLKLVARKKINLLNLKLPYQFSIFQGQHCKHRSYLASHQSLFPTASHESQHPAS